MAQTAAPSTPIHAALHELRRVLRDGSPRQWAMASGVVVLTIHVTALVAYINISQPVVSDLLAVSYPVIWITAGIVSAVWVGRAVDSRRQRGIGLAVGGIYTLVLLWISGILMAGSGTGSLMIESALPGWGPVVHYHGPVVGLSVVPFKLIAYLSLGYMVYVLVAATGHSVRAAALGIASCVGCTASALLAGAGMVGGTQLTWLSTLAGYETGTVVLLATFGLLVRAAQRTTG